MAKAKWRVLATKTKVSAKNGKKQGVYAQCSDGKVRTFLNPHGKGEKFAMELKRKKRFTNLGEQKFDENGNPLSLTKTGAAYRSGYLQAQKDSANAYRAKKKRNNRGSVNKPKRGKSVSLPKAQYHFDPLTGERVLGGIFPNPDDIHGTYGGSIFPIYEE